MSVSPGLSPSMRMFAFCFLKIGTVQRVCRCVCGCAYVCKSGQHIQFGFFFVPVRIHEEDRIYILEIAVRLHVAQKTMTTTTTTAAQNVTLV